MVLIALVAFETRVFASADSADMWVIATVAMLFAVKLIAGLNLCEGFLC